MRKTIDCVSCGRRVPKEPRTLRDELRGSFAGEDWEAAGMCHACLSAIEEHEAIIAARLERRGHAVSNTALAVLSCRAE